MAALRRTAQFVSLACLASLGSVGACTSFGAEGTPTPAEPDGGPGPQREDGGPDPVPGSPATQGITLTVDPVDPRFIVQDKDNEIAFKITRVGTSTGPITVVASGLPVGSTAAPITVNTGATKGTLRVHPAAAAPQGSLTFKLKATESTPGGATSEAPVNAFVRGAPGALDTTFASGGQLVVGTNSSAFVIDSMQRIYAAGDDISRFDRDGKPAPGKLADAMGTYKLFIKAGQLVACGGVTLATRGFYRFNLEGAPDQGFGVQGFVSFNRGGTIGADGIEACGVTSAGALAASVATVSDSLLLFNNANGSNGGAVGYGGSMTAGLFTDDGAFVGAKYAVGNESLIRASGAGVESSFNVLLPGTVDGITDVVQDSTQRYVVVGPSFIGRVTHGGALEAFPNTQPPFGGTLGEAHLALASDGKIIRAQTIGQQCAVMRYNADGTPDKAFGTNGAALLPATGCRVRGVALFADGRILLGDKALYRVWAD
ncbi:hypothetical protein BH11MYX4_BH11MYX4_23220 [soil metagenome]